MAEATSLPLFRSDVFVSLGIPVSSTSVPMDFETDRLRVVFGVRTGGVGALELQ